MSPKLSLIVAVAENGVIGKDGGLPWHISADLKRFRKLTMGKPIVMGRKTYESIGRPLPGRVNIVLTANPSFQAAGCLTLHSLEQAQAAAGEAEEVFVIGGAALYAAAFPSADRLCLTRVHADVEGDTFFPPFDLGEWTETFREEHPDDEKSGVGYTFFEYTRKR